MPTNGLYVTMKILRPTAVFSILLIGLVLSWPFGTQAGESNGDINPSSIVVTAGKSSVTLGELATAIRVVQQSKHNNALPDRQGLAAMSSQILDSRLLAKQAEELGLDKDPDIQNEIHLATDRILARHRLMELDKQSDSLNYESLAKERYLVDKKSFTTPELIWVSHILLRDNCRGEEEAMKLAQSLKKRLDENPDAFDEIAREYSEDDSTREKAGDLDWQSRKTLEESFANAAFSLTEKGTIADPIVTRFGVHLIRLNGRRGGNQQTFEEVKSRLMKEEHASVLDAKRREYIAELRRNAGVEYDDEVLDGYFRQLMPK